MAVGHILIQAGVSHLQSWDSIRQHWEVIDSVCSPGKAQALSSSRILLKVLNLSVPQFPNKKNNNNKSTY